MSVHRMQQVRGWLVVSLLLGAVACSSGDESGGSADGGDPGGDGGSGSDGGLDPDAGGGSDGGPDPDGGGGEGDADDDIEADVDLSQPPNSRFDGFPTQFTQSLARFEFSCNQPGCTFECSIDDGSWETCTSPLEVTRPDGTYSLSILATNTEGVLEEEPLEIEWTVDSVAPETIAVSGPDGLYNFLNVPLAVYECDDAIQTSVTCSANGTEFGSCDQHWVTRGPSGSYVFQARCEDIAGNVDATPVEWRFEIDGEAPVVSFEIAPGEDATNATEIEFEMACDDTRPCTWQCGLSEAELQPCDASFTVGPLEPGNYTMYAQATDAAGNVGYGQWPFEVTPGVVAVEANGNDLCAITPQGQLWCMGDLSAYGDFGYRGWVDVGLEDVVQVEMAAYDSFVCVLLADGVVQCAGQNQYGQLGRGTSETYETGFEPVLTEARFVDLAVGQDHACAVDTLGATWCWGNNDGNKVNFGGTSRIEVVPRRIEYAIAQTEVEAGEFHTCALLVNGDALCWGNNSFGQLGSGNLFPGTSAVNAPDGTRFVELQSSTRSNCARTDDNRLVCWGDNFYGQLGLGSVSQVIADPTEVTDLVTGAFAISDESVCLQRDDGTHCAGEIYFGVDALSTDTFQLVDADNWSQMAAQSDMFCGITAGGRLSCRGRSYWEMAPGRGALQTAESQGGNWSEIVTTRFGAPTCGIQASDQRLYCWGQASEPSVYGTLGSVLATSPAVIQEATTFERVTTGSGFICGIATDGRLLCWGRNYAFVFGSDQWFSTNSPIEPAGPGPWLDVDALENHVCAIREPGELYCWGSCPQGACAVPDFSLPVTTPTRVGDASDWVEVETSGARTCGIRENAAGERSAWCLGYFGATNDLEPVRVDARNDWAQIVPGDSMDLGLSTSGQLRALGRRETPGAPRPTVQDYPGDWTAVATNTLDFCAIDTEGQPHCWGRSDEPHLIGPGLRTAAESPTPIEMPDGVAFESMTMARSFWCGLAADGERWCWGSRVQYQLGDGFGWASWDAIEVP